MNSGEVGLRHGETSPWAVWVCGDVETDFSHKWVRFSPVAVWGHYGALCSVIPQLEGFASLVSAHHQLPSGCLSQQAVLPLVLQVPLCIILEPHLSKRNVTNFFV